MFEQKSKKMLKEIQGAQINQEKEKYEIYVKLKEQSRILRKTKEALVIKER